MEMRFLIILTYSVLFSEIGSEKSDIKSEVDLEEMGRIFMKRLNKLSGKYAHETALRNWDYASNLTEYNKKAMLEASLEFSNFTKKQWKKSLKFPWTTFTDPDLRRQFKKFSNLGVAVLPPSKYKRFEEVVSKMKEIYGQAKVCDYHNQTKCDLSLEPDLNNILATSRDPEVLKYYWLEWRKVSGKNCRSLFNEYVELSNEAARKNNFSNTADYWIEDFEYSDFEKELGKLWKELKPLYLELHTYVRRRLREKYGENVVPSKDVIPAHLLGNMWSQSWTSIYDITAPFPNRTCYDVTKTLKKKKYTPKKMFKLAENFFKSLNLSVMPDSFWKNSIIKKPKDRELICHASAWDFSNARDFRIKMCTVVNMKDLLTIHHEMGHVEYYLQYKHQPYIYRSGANSGFHEAVGDTIALSVKTPKHLRKIGLLGKTKDDKKNNINFLYLSALEKIAFLPFGYLIDLYRWAIFRGQVQPEDYNCFWWSLRWDFQGIEPPAHRSEKDFDPASKYHIVSNTPYIRYFVSAIIQFQFHKALCEIAGQFDPNDPSAKPLHKCDIYKSVEAGNALKKMLEMGSSKPWPDAMEALTGQRKLDASAMIQYFEPLYKWLKKDNKKHKEAAGWGKTPLRMWCRKFAEVSIT